MPMPDLEDQLCGWVPDTGEASPDRLDALVWALTALSQERKFRAVIWISAEVERLRSIYAFVNYPSSNEGHFALWRTLKDTAS